MILVGIEHQPRVEVAHLVCVVDLQRLVVRHPVVLFAGDDVPGTRRIAENADCVFIFSQTLAPEHKHRVFVERLAKSLFDAGGGNLLGIGTDEPVYTNLLPGFAYHRELLAMTYAGIPPADVLKAATIMQTGSYG